MQKAKQRCVTSNMLQEPIIISLGIQMQILQSYTSVFCIKKGFTTSRKLSIALQKIPYCYRKQTN